MKLKISPVFKIMNETENLNCSICIEIIWRMKLNSSNCIQITKRMKVMINNYNNKTESGYCKQKSMIGC